VLIPLGELAQHLDLLPSFDTPIIAYCGSGWRATIAMTTLWALGWKDVKVMKGGSYTGWVGEGYPTVEGLPPQPAALEEAAIVVYCGSGHRSTIAMSILRSHGYTDVRSLKGGLGGWQSEGYPVVEFAMP